MLRDQIQQVRERALGKLNPKQKQWGLLVVIGAGFFLVMWGMFALSDNRPAPPPRTDPVGITTVDKGPQTPIIAGGQLVRPADIWIAKAGQDLDQLKKDREELKQKNIAQDKAAKDMMARFDELQKKLSAQASVRPSPAQAAPAEAAEAAPAKLPPPPKRPLPPLPPPPRPGAEAHAGLPLGDPGMAAPPSTTLVRVSLSDARVPSATHAANGGTPVPPAGETTAAGKPLRTLDNFLPISFTKAVLLGGLDAPTGGQSQSNPHPVLLRLEDNAMLPNKFRGQIRECFVVGAGYGDLSSERAYIRTEKLSCMRNDGTAMEIAIKGSIFGEDGKVGVRGRLVSKQGQVLANALIAGVVSGIGAGVQGRFTTSSATAFGNVATTDPNHAFEAGMGQGFSKAMDRLAQYYITLAEKMFPIIEVDAGRLVDVVLTEGATLEVPLTAVGARMGQTHHYSGREAQMRPVGASHDD
jgi:conjugal transfer pilus assembly protein TraB